MNKQILIIILLLSALSRNESAGQISIGSSSLEALVVKYAPQIRHSQKENYHMSSVDWYLSKSMVIDKNRKIVSKNVSEANIASKAINKKEHHITRKKAEAKYGNINSAKAYVHVQRSVYQMRPYFEDDIEIQYWFFYPWNGDQGGLHFSSHEGDWEHVKVHVKANGEIRRVVTSSHGDYNVYEKGDFKSYGTHPIIYSANESHAMYNDTGYNHPDISALDLCDNNGWWFNSWKPGKLEIVELNTTFSNHPWYGKDDKIEIIDSDVKASNPKWLKFIGRWGWSSNGVTGPKTAKASQIWRGKHPQIKNSYTDNGAHDMISGARTLCVGNNYTYKINKKSSRKVKDVRWTVDREGIFTRESWSGNSFKTGAKGNYGDGEVHLTVTAIYNGYNIRTSHIRTMWLGKTSSSAFGFAIDNNRPSCGDIAIATPLFDTYYTPLDVKWSKSGDIASVVGSKVKATVKTKIFPNYNYGCVYVKINNACDNPSVDAVEKRVCVNIPCGSSGGGGIGKRTLDRDVEEPLSESVGDDINFYPNPTTGLVRFNGIPDERTLDGLNVRVSDFSGKEIMHFSRTALENSSFQFDLSSYESGIYMISVYQNESLLDVRKVVKL